MQTAVLEKTRENIKKSYKSSFGELFIHGLTINGVEYEYHAKSNTLAMRPGQTIWYEGLETDKQGNPKIKKPTTKQPEGWTAPPVPSPSTPTQDRQVVSADNGKGDWLRVFSALCTLKSGTQASLDESVDKIVAATDKIVARLK